MMGFFPLLMYYFWICLWFYDGQLVRPKSLVDIKPFFLRMAQHVCEVCRLRIRVHRKEMTDYPLFVVRRTRSPLPRHLLSTRV